MTQDLTWQVFVTYRKVGRLRYLSHLDVTRAFDRALRRADLPVRYTAGFHQRTKVHLGPALPVGAEGEAEMMGIELTRRVQSEEVERRLNAQLPPELAVTRADTVPVGAPSPLKGLAWASYLVTLGAEPAVSREELARAVEAALAARELIVTDPEGEKAPVDARPRIRELALVPGEEGLVLQMTLGLAQETHLSPDRCLRALEGLLPNPTKLRWLRLVRTCMQAAAGHGPSCPPHEPLGGRTR